MSIIYDLVFKNNKRIPYIGPCFGAFSRTEFPDGWIRGNYFEKLRMSREEGRNQCRALHNTFDKAEFIQFYPQPGEAWGYPSFFPEGSDPTQNYLEEMRLLLADLPFLKASVHPLLKVIRVKVKDVAADKVMMTLFLLRNLTEYYGVSYMYLRKEFNFKPKAAAILSSFWVRGSLYGLRASQLNFTYTSVGEYNWLSPKTFGVSSLVNFLNNSSQPNWDPWIQESFTEIPGYRRDSWFGSSTNRREYSFNGNTRNLVDCLSVEGDSNIWTSGVRNSSYNTKTAFETSVVNPFVTVCRNNGYEPVEA